MRKIYLAPDIEIIELSSEDICKDDIIDASIRDNLAEDITPGNDAEDEWIED
jgi:hypothetical protein